MQHIRDKKVVYMCLVASFSSSELQDLRLPHVHKKLSTCQRRLLGKVEVGNPSFGALNVTSLRGRLLNTYPGKCLPSHITLPDTYGKD